MNKSIRYSRRQVTRQLGIVAGLGLAARGFGITNVATPAQVEGPFHPLDPNVESDADLTLLAGHAKVATGEIILVRGRVRDTEGQPLSDAVVDVWQANHFGRYTHPRDSNPAPLDPNFQGWGLLTTSTEGQYSFKTIKPGAYPLNYLGGAGWRCRHIHFKVSRPGYQALTTQMYFHGDPLISRDLEIARVPELLRPSLIAKPETDAETGLPRYRFDVILARA